MSAASFAVSNEPAAEPAGERVLLPSHYEFQVFYDGECPLCMREIRMLQRLDRRGAICFTDIASPTFRTVPVGATPQDLATEGPPGLDHAALMARIHGRLPDGTVVEGVEVFRRLYAAVGFRRLVAASRWPGIRHLLNLAYAGFARNRLRLTGRCTPDGACRVPAAR